MAMSKGEVEEYLKTTDLRAPLEMALNAAVSSTTKQPDKFFAAFFKTKALLTDMGLTDDMVGPCDGLLPQPVAPSHKLVLVEYNILGHPGGVGGSDKGKNGHRIDSIPIANGVIRAGSMCMPMKYVPEGHDAFAAVVSQCDGIIVRIEPGAMKEPDQQRFDALMREMAASGKTVWSAADVKPDDAAPAGGEGEVLVLAAGGTCLSLTETQGKKQVVRGVDEPQFAELKRKLFAEELPRLLPAGEPLPVVWTAAMVPVEGSGDYAVRELKCACAGIAKFQACAHPDKTLFDVVGDDLAEATLAATEAAKFAVGTLAMKELDRIGYVTPFETGPCIGLSRQPIRPQFKLVLVEHNVPGHESGVGGSDKGMHGHRIDSIPIANGVIKAGSACAIIKYVPEAHEQFAAVIKATDGVIVRIQPGELSPPEQEAFDALMSECVALGVTVWSSPEVQLQFGCRDSLAKVAGLSCGLPDTLAYYDEAEFSAGLKKGIAFSSRVVKQNLGSSGEGVWTLKLRDHNYCGAYGEALAEDDWQIECIEASDGHSEVHTVKEFVEFCAYGRTSAAGKWASKGNGLYLYGGKAEGGLLLDQRFCPRYAEGEVRVLAAGGTCLQFTHKKPVLGAAGSEYTEYGPNEAQFAELKRKLFADDVPRLMAALGLGDQPLPLMWTADLVPTDGDAPDSTEWTLSGFNCTCVPISKFQSSAFPNMTADDVNGANTTEGTRIADAAAGAAVASLKASLSRKPSYLAEQLGAIAGGAGPWQCFLGPCPHLLKQPAEPRHRLLLVEYFVPGHEGGVGGADKGNSGHRVDSIPIANGVIKAGSACVPVRYVPALHEAFAALVGRADGVIVRVEPGQMDAEAQASFDGLMRECPIVWTTNLLPEEGAEPAAHYDCACLGIAGLQAYASAEYGLEDLSGSELVAAQGVADAAGRAAVAAVDAKRG